MAWTLGAPVTEPGVVTAPAAPVGTAPAVTVEPTSICRYSSPAVVGHVYNADRTHFQERGAFKVASLVVEGLKEDPARLSGLIALLK